MAHWTEDASQIVNPLRRLALQSDTGLIRDVLTEAVGELNVNHYDNWNGGTRYYTLTLRVPDPAYLDIGDNLEQYEKQILERVKRLTRGETNDFIDDVLIQPSLDTPPRATSDTQFWLPGHFRLFISHLAEHKDSAGRLKTALERYGITSFVAHEDIEPTREWERELESALLTMDGLVAILAPGFSRSNWTDHEVGVAIGRQVIVIPIMYGRSPHGLMRRLQGIKAQGRMLSKVSDDIFTTLLRNRQSSRKLVTCLVEQLLIAGTPDDAARKLRLLLRASDISGEQVNKVRERLQNDEKLLADDTVVTLGGAEE